MTTRPGWFIASLLLVLWLSGCAPSAVEPVPAGGEGVASAGFWKGLWHGFTVLFTFIISLFNDGIGVYEVANRGHLYDLGFVLGAMMFFGCSGRGACRTPCKKD